MSLAEFPEPKLRPGLLSRALARACWIVPLLALVPSALAVELDLTISSALHAETRQGIVVSLDEPVPDAELRAYWISQGAEAMFETEVTPLDPDQVEAVLTLELFSPGEGLIKVLLVQDGEPIAAAASDLLSIKSLLHLASPIAYSGVPQSITWQLQGSQYDADFTPSFSSDQETEVQLLQGPAAGTGESLLVARLADGVERDVVSITLPQGYGTLQAALEVLPAPVPPVGLTDLPNRIVVDYPVFKLDVTARTFAAIQGVGVRDNPNLPELATFFIDNERTDETLTVTTSGECQESVELTLRSYRNVISTKAVFDYLPTATNVHVVELVSPSTEEMIDRVLAGIDAALEDADAEQAAALNAAASSAGDALEQARRDVAEALSHVAAALDALVMIEQEGGSIARDLAGAAATIINGGHFPPLHPESDERRAFEASLDQAYQRIEQGYYVQAVTAFIEIDANLEPLPRQRFVSLTREPPQLVDLGVNGQEEPRFLDLADEPMELVLTGLETAFIRYADRVEAMDVISGAIHASIPTGDEVFLTYSPGVDRVLLVDGTTLMSLAAGGASPGAVLATASVAEEALFIGAMTTPEFDGAVIAHLGSASLTTVDVTAGSGSDVLVLSTKLLDKVADGLSCLITAWARGSLYILDALGKVEAFDLTAPAPVEVGSSLVLPDPATGMAVAGDVGQLGFVGLNQHDVVLIDVDPILILRDDGPAYENKPNQLALSSDGTHVGLSDPYWRRLQVHFGSAPPRVHLVAGRPIGIQASPAE